MSIGIAKILHMYPKNIISELSEWMQSHLATRSTETGFPCLLFSNLRKSSTLPVVICIMNTKNDLYSNLKMEFLDFRGFYCSNFIVLWSFPLWKHWILECYCIRTYVFHYFKTTWDQNSVNLWNCIYFYRSNKISMKTQPGNSYRLWNIRVPCFLII